MSDQCPLYPQKRTLELNREMSALCQKRTSGLDLTRGYSALLLRRGDQELRTPLEIARTRVAEASILLWRCRSLRAGALIRRRHAAQALVFLAAVRPAKPSGIPPRSVRFEEQVDARL